MSAGVVGGIVAALLIALAINTLRQPRGGRDGWYTLKPSWIIHGSVVLCALLLGLFVWLWFNGARMDEPGERLSTAALIVFCIWGGGYFVITAYARTIAWSDNRLRVRRWFRGEQIRDFDEIVSLTEMMGTYTLAFTDGSRIQFPVAMHGSNELAAKIGMTDA